MRFKLIILLSLAIQIIFYNSIAFSQAPGSNCANAATLTLPTTAGNSISTGSQTTCGTLNNFLAGSYCTNASYGGGEDGVYYDDQYGQEDDYDEYQQNNNQ